MSSPAPERATWGSLVRAARDRLRAAGIESPEVEADLLMRQALRRPGDALPTKAWLLPRRGQNADDALRERFEALVGRRVTGEPSAYITGEREFYGLAFDVTPDVLIPRPETELLVGTAVKWARGSSGHFTTYPPPPSTQVFLNSGRKVTDGLTIVDVGTGSGAIAVALARQLPAAAIIATDVSWSALAVARRNARRHGVEGRISFRHGDLLMPVDGYVDLIVANLPYVTEVDWRALSPEVRDHEPALALRGGDDGLALIRALLSHAPRYLRPAGAVCLEFGAGQAGDIEAAARTSFPTGAVDVFEDFAGIPRVLLARC